MSVRAPLVTVEALTDGAAKIRAPLVAAEALITGLPKVRSPLLTVEALATGLPKVRAPLVAIEVLSLAPPEPAVVSTAIFPSLTEGWSVTRKPMLSSRISTHQSGHERRTPQQQYPLRQFTLTYEVLRSGAAFAELQAIEGFFLQQYGSYGQFLFKDKYTPDFQVTGGPIGIGDGTTTSFKLARSWGGFLEPVGYVFPEDLTAVYLNGGTAISAAGYSVTAPNNLVFAAAPAAGAVITADFAFYFQVRFGDDSLELEEFMSELFELKECHLQQILPS